MNIHTATAKIAAKLQADLVDPINDRSSAWVYDDDRRIDLDATPFPKILLLKLDKPSLKLPVAIGNPSTENSDEIQIQIKTGMGHHYTYDEGEGSVDYTDEEFAGFIGQQVTNLIQLNHDYWVAQGFLDVLPIRDEFDTDKDRNTIFNVYIEMHYISDPNN